MADKLVIQQKMLKDRLDQEVGPLSRAIRQAEIRDKILKEELERQIELAKDSLKMAVNEAYYSAHKQSEYYKKTISSLEEKILDIKESSGTGIKGIRMLSGMVAVNGNDNSMDYLSKKLVAGTNIALATSNNRITISSTVSGVSIGGAVTDGTAGSVLFVNPDNTLAQDNSGLKYITSTKQLLVGAGSALFPCGLYVERTATETAGNSYGQFLSFIVNPASASSAFFGGLSFSVITSGSQNLSSQIKGIDAVVEHATAGSLSQALGANFLVKKSGTGDVTVLYGLNFSVGNTNASGSVILGVAAQFAPPTAVGAIANTAGAYILNQGGANIANTFGIYIDGQSGSSTNNAAIYSIGGIVVFNGGQDATSDFTVMSDTDSSNLVSDASANTVQVGAATASDSAKFYVAGKISTSSELEVNGDLNHDGSNVGFYGTAPAAKPTATGSRGGNAALASLLTALAGLGLITDSTS